MKDKEWLVKEVDRLRLENTLSNNPMMISNRDVIAKVSRLIDQLDEPQKPVIPQFVADWFEKNKDLTFIEAMDELFWDHHDEKMVEFLISEDNEHIRENQELLMKVWLYADYGGKGMNRTILHTQSKDSFIKYLESELAAKNQTLNAYREINEQLSTENKQLRRDNAALKKEDGEVDA